MRTYVKVALRNLRREKLYAALNVAGLALGIGCCLILGLYLWSEFTYDRHHVNHERIHRVVHRIDMPNNDGFALARTSPALGVMLVEDYPDVILQHVRFQGLDQEALLRNDDQAHYWDRVYLADDNVFDVFTHEIVYGDPGDALTRPGTIAISRSVAQRHFGGEDPIGRTLYNAANDPLTVTLVYEDLPPNTHLKYDVLIANKGIVALPDDINARRQMLNVTSTYTYVLLPDGYGPREYEALNQQFYETHVAGVAPPGLHWESWLQPLTSIHLRSDLMIDEPTGNLLYLYALAVVGLFILSVACINYVNLATARAARRARAIGLRKILGVGRTSLIAQILTESILFAMLATVLGVIAVEVLITLPAVTALVGRPLELDLFGTPLLAMTVLAFGLLVGLAAGLYPALKLSSFTALSALAGRYEAKGGGGLRLREALVLIQFAISVGVIAATLLMTAQMRYVADKALGFEAENRIIVPLRGADLIEQAALIAAELSRHASVLGVTTSQTVMGGSMYRSTRSSVEADDGTTTELLYNDIGDVGPDFLSVMGMRIVQGRDFSEAMGTDVGNAVIVNETFVREMGWRDPIGKRIGSPESARGGQVIGVVEDFHFSSLHERVEPFIILRNDPDFSNLNPANRPFQQRLMIINVARDGLRDALRYIETRFGELDPHRPFEFSFLDDNLQALYLAERRLMRMIGIFAAVCIFVAALGLFGLSAFATEQRTKEIGIRKVLGATVAEIVLLLSRRVLLLITVGGVAAAVATWIFMLEWLSGFAYRAPVNPVYLVVAVAGAGAVAIATIALQSWRTARADPIDALRYE